MFMRELRKTVKPLLWVVAIGFVGSLFFTYTRMSQNQGQQNTLVEVNGETISYTEFIESYRSAYNRYVENTGENLSPEMETYLRNQVLSQLITNALLYEQAQKAGIEVSRAEVEDQVKQIMSSFGSRENFMRYLNYQRTKYSDFENEVQKQIVISKLTRLIRNNVIVTEKELRNYWLLQNEKLDLAYLFLDPEKYAQNIKVDTEKAREYYEKNKEEFRVPEKVKVKYILISPDEFKNEVEIKEEELKSYYEEHPEEFRVEEKRRASHILIKVPQDASEEEKEKAREKIEQIKKQLEEGADFSALAKKYSDDRISAEQGGDLGYFTYSAMTPQFSKEVFSLERTGQVSEIVETPYGFHLIKLTDIKPGYKKQFSEVKEQIKEELLQRKAAKLARERLKEVEEKIRKGELTIEQYAKHHPQRVKATPLFARYENLPGISWSSKFNETAFSLKPGEISSPLELSQGYCIIALQERQPSHIPSWEEGREKVIRQLAENKAREITRQRALNITKKIKEGEKMSSFGEEWEYKTVNSVTRGSWVEEIPGEERHKFLNVAFSLSQGKVSDPFALSKGYYIIKVLDRKISWDKFASQKDEFREQLLERKRQQLLSSWLKNIREKAKIVDHTSSFFSSSTASS